MLSWICSNCYQLPYQEPDESQADLPESKIVILLEDHLKCSNEQLQYSQQYSGENPKVQTHRPIGQEQERAIAGPDDCLDDRPVGHLFQRSSPFECRSSPAFRPEKTG